jgi:Protein of unknown function (DUF2851)
LPEQIQDNYPKDLKAWYDYLVVKYNLEKAYFEPIQFYKLRPDNFPTIRLAQLATVYSKHKNLFSKIIETNTVAEYYKLFDVSVSEYWLHHYSFDKPSKYKEKSLSKSFIDLLIINTVLPFKFAYAKELGKDVSESIMLGLEQLLPENNSVVEKFKNFGVNVTNAFESQSLLQLKNEYCDKSKCLQCSIGNQLLKN